MAYSPQTITITYFQYKMAQN